MTAIQGFWLVLAAAWMLAEWRLLRRDKQASNHDQGSARWLWLCVLAGLGVALICKQLRWLPLGLDGTARLGLALPVFIAGISLRGLAVYHLGHHFSARVRLQERHTLIRSGVYRWLRHPSYTGLLLALTGAGLAMGDWLAVAALLLPSMAAVLYRIHIEETALAEHFPQDYPDYCASTKRLLPWVY